MCRGGQENALSRPPRRPLTRRVVRKGFDVVFVRYDKVNGERGKRRRKVSKRQGEGKDSALGQFPPALFVSTCRQPAEGNATNTQSVTATSRGLETDVLRMPWASAQPLKFRLSRSEGNLGRRFPSSVQNSVISF